MVLLEATGKNSIVVTHEAWMKLLMCHILNLSGEKRFKFYVDLCGISELEYAKENKGWQIKRFNQVLL